MDRVKTLVATARKGTEDPSTREHKERLDSSLLVDATMTRSFIVKTEKELAKA